jgi:hypothetical protein
MKLTPAEKQFILAAMEREATYIRDCINEYEEKMGKVHIIHPNYYLNLAQDIKTKLKL